MHQLSLQLPTSFQATSFKIEIFIILCMYTQALASSEKQTFSIFSIDSQLFMEFNFLKTY